MIYFNFEKTSEEGVDKYLVGEVGNWEYFVVIENLKVFGYAAKCSAVGIIFDEEANCEREMPSLMARAIETIDDTMARYWRDLQSTKKI